MCVSKEKQYFSRKRWYNRKEVHGVSWWLYNFLDGDIYIFSRGLWRHSSLGILEIPPNTDLHLEMVWVISKAIPAH